MRVKYDKFMCNKWTQIISCAMFLVTVTVPRPLFRRNVDFLRINNRTISEIERAGARQISVYAIRRAVICN